MEVTQASAKRRGRPPGSKNKKTLVREASRVERIETVDKPAEVKPEDRMPAIHAFLSERQDYKCDCGERLEMNRQHWVNNHGKHLCLTCASAEVRQAS